MNDCINERASNNWDMDRDNFDFHGVLFNLILEISLNCKPFCYFAVQKAALS